MSVAVKAVESTRAALDAIVERAEGRFAAHRQQVFRDTDRMFARLMLAQWVFAVVLALVVSPWAWQGKEKTVHVHVWVAIFLGGAITSLPVLLARERPGEASTRHVIACAQMLWSALLIHLTGGRIETHFHVFGSLAFLAFYRDWPVMLTGAAVIAVDHFLRGILWPESVYGIPNPEWWRFLEHAGWVIFCVSFLVMSCRKSEKDMRVMAERGAELEALSENQWRNSSVLERAANDDRGDR
jgi:two-component system, NtrC family, sensor histidine kinase HydH